MLEATFLDINTRIATQLRHLRDEYGWSIEQVAARTGVSRAMISRIERAQSSPTASVLVKLSIGLAVPLTALFGPGRFNTAHLRLRNPVASRARQPEWRDPETGYISRTLTPEGARQSLRLNEMMLPAGARVIVECPAGERAQRQVWMLEGNLELRIGVGVLRTEVLYLSAGDCIALTVNAPAIFRNPGGTRARYLLAVGGTGAGA